MYPLRFIHFRHLLGGNNHLLTNNKFCKIGCVQEDKCSLYKTDSESLYLITFECRHTKQFRKEFQYYFYTLTREFVCLSLQRLYYRNIINKFSFAELFVMYCNAILCKPRPVVGEGKTQVQETRGSPPRLLLSFHRCWSRD